MNPLYGPMAIPVRSGLGAFGFFSFPMPLRNSGTNHKCPLEPAP
eukprot:CAMPEP_0172851128 /NCGR_PEP_ID=MMETSP1075-20121228/51464_1 /TAXON_ID=2916 /ORGANISM="Ceratium fusus, Strain PA161109" /LENGTH=43 /DNA_ID= /DNA_START= /DNA_END= /DNA_ORIENTATION=